MKKLMAGYHREGKRFIMEQKGSAQTKALSEVWKDIGTTAAMKEAFENDPYFKEVLEEMYEDLTDSRKRRKKEVTQSNIRKKGKGGREVKGKKK